jgi:hypothetical protein
MNETLPPYKRRKRVRRLQLMLLRIRAVRAQKERDPRTDPEHLHTLLAEIKALEWVLAEVGEDVTCTP